MVLFNKLLSGAKTYHKLNLKPVFRLNEGGFQHIGAHTRAADTRSTEQLLENIEYFAQHNPEVAKFKNELKSMNPEHLGLVSDICELSNHHEFLPQVLDMKKLSLKDGRSLFAYLMEILPKASKNNPKALEFASEVINQTDSSTAKYFLADFGRILEVPEAAEHMAAAKPLIKDFAEQTLNGYKMDFENERNFMNFIRILIDQRAKTEKIAMLKKLTSAADKAPGENMIYLDKFVRSNTPVKQVEENIAVLPKVLQNASSENKSIDIVDFVNKNVNLD